MSRDQKLLETKLSLLATQLRNDCGVECIFGIAGDPITPLITFCEKKNIKFFGFRNEQAGSYAASSVAFLSAGRTIGVCMSVAGPGFTNTLTGIVNANVNGWPVVIVCPLAIEEGQFQGMDQLSAANPSSGLCKGYVVYDGKPDTVKRAFDLARSERGGVVIFVPTSTQVQEAHPVTESSLRRHISVTTRARSTQRPLVVIGSRTRMHPQYHEKVLNFIFKNKIPFITDPMGRGLIPESDPLCMTACRSRAISTCDSVFVFFGQLDWMLHFGKPPKWASDCIFTLLDEANQAVDWGALESAVNVDCAWRTELTNMASTNKRKLSARMHAKSGNGLPNHWEAIGGIRRVIARPENQWINAAIIVSEGANTMDVARVGLDVGSLRLDAGRWGTMGAGLAYVIASHAVCPEKLVIAIEGDSAFGFSGMELETIVRYKCRAIIVIFNNGGIYNGHPDNATAFTPNVRHDLMMQSFGGTGISCRDFDGNVEAALSRAVQYVSKGVFPVLVDAIIDPKSGTLSGSLSRM